MSQSSPAPTNSSPTPDQERDRTVPSVSAEPAPSYVKLAMRNMVKKGGKSLFHFGLTATGLLTVLVGLAYLTR
jgi:hypothetical protein